MRNFIPKIVEESVKLLVQRPEWVQVGALCYRHKKGKLQILLVTSRGTKRWIIPKGWPMHGKHGSPAAKQEAWEEAGVTEAEIANDPLGEYRYRKKMAGGLALPVTTYVYPCAVTKVAKKYPEKSQRRRKWFSPKKAAQKVAEPDLKKMILEFSKQMPVNGNSPKP